MNDTCGKGRVGVVMRGKCRLILASLVALSMAGCAGQSPAVVPVSRMEAISHNQRGVTAEARGEYQQALEEFSRALRISSSIENSEGSVVALVNSSRVHRHNGNATAALSMISRAIPLVTPQAALYPEVAFEMAQVTLLSGDLDTASAWASKAVEADTGAQRGMRINLLARILYLKGNLAESELQVRRALLLNREHEVRAEEANSFRLQGDIMAAGKRYDEAAECYGQALAIDKALGKNRKIASDIRALALLSLMQNDLEQALGFYHRSFAVSSAGGDRPGAADDLLHMSLIYEKRGEKVLSEGLLMERDKMLKNPGTPL